MRGTSLPRLLVLSAVSALMLAGVGVPSASAAVKNRISVAVSNSSRAEIPHSVQPKVAWATDLGPTRTDTKLEGMSICFNMTPAQEAALDQLLADQQNPASPRYHQWLTPTEFAAEFGLSSADIAKVTSWLTGQGFTVTGVANGGTFVTFNGTVAQAEAAFGTSIHNLSYKGETHFANVANAQVPGALATVVGDVTGLNNFRLRPHSRTSVANPQFTSSVSSNHYMAPGDIYTVYDMNPLLSTYNGAGIGTGGNCHSVPTGTTCGDIAVTGQVDINLADITAFRSASGLSTSILPTVVLEGTDPGAALSCNNCYPNESDLAESSIDLEWSGAMAPSATILFVNGQDVMFNSMTQAIDKDLAPIVTTSYGNCEAAWGSNDINTLNQLFKEANAQGQTVLAAAGDGGAADCDAGPSAIEGLAVDYPGSSPYVTSLGGTSYTDGSATGATQYWSSTNGAVGQGSALSYIPETIWNDVSLGGFGGGGGGASAYFTKPAWQQGPGVPADASRDVPDLALNASDGQDSFLYCVNVALGDSCTSGYRIANNDLDTAGGTSFDSQIFGGMLALVEQKIGSRIGNANPIIYALANSTAYYQAGKTITTLPTVVFNDVTAGNNAMPCTAGTPNCTSSSSFGYSAGSGYDLASGWGSVNLSLMANAWGGVTALNSGSLGPNLSATSLTASSASVTAGTGVTLTAKVTGASGTPTGSVQFLSNNVALGSPVTLTTASGVTSATYTFNTTCSTLGQQILSASYSGDATYQGSKGPALATGEVGDSGGTGIASNGSVQTAPLILTVSSGICPDFSVAPSGTGVTVSGGNASLSVAAGGTIPAVTVTAAPVNSFIGTVVFTATAVSNTGYLPAVSFSPASVSVTPSTPATTSMTLSGITAELRLPNAPGHVDQGIELARLRSGRTPWYAGSGVTVASLLLLTFPRKRRLGGLLMALLAVALIGGASGCGGSSQPGPPTTNVNQYAGTYTVTVTGTYTSSGNTVTAHSTSVTYLIN